MNKKCKPNFQILLSFIFTISIAGILFSMTSCQKKSSPENLSAHPELYARGRAVYQSNCTSCHNSNPKLAGSLGPDLKGSSLELLNAKILKGEYPVGYTPKRKTKVMQPMPQISQDIQAIYEFLRH